MPEKSRIQQLMDEAYDQWQSNDNWSLEDFRRHIVKNMTKEHLMAVQIGNLNYQVENGGFLQWHDNGYSIDIEDLISYCKEINTEASRKVKGLLYEVQEFLEFHYEGKKKIIDLLVRNMMEDYVETIKDCFQLQLSHNFNNLDNKYYKINDKFLSDVETFLKRGENK